MLKDLVIKMRSRNLLMVRRAVDFIVSGTKHIAEQGLSTRTVAFSLLNMTNNYLDGFNLDFWDIFSQNQYEIFIPNTGYNLSLASEVFSVLIENFPIKNVISQRNAIEELFYQFIVFDLGNDIEIASISVKEINNYTYPKSTPDCPIIITRSKSKEVYEILNNLMWKKFNTNNIRLQKDVSYNYETFEPIKDDYVCALGSEKATEIIGHISHALNHNINRSILIYGPTGSGKSTIAREISSKLNLRTLRVCKDSYEVAEKYIKIYKPDMIIFDDVDRFLNYSFLEFLEKLSISTKVIIATANVVDDIDPALIRPGRFDELRFIEKLDETVVHHMLGEFDTKTNFNLVKNWPIAFVKEFVNRCKFMTEQESRKSIIAELKPRVILAGNSSVDICKKKKPTRKFSRRDGDKVARLTEVPVLKECSSA